MAEFLAPRIRNATTPDHAQSLLLLVVDTEEEFDWQAEFSRENWRVGLSIDNLQRLQDAVGPYGVKPTYVVDYAVANDARAVDTIGRLYQDGLCDIGAHLHPWLNPPLVEAMSPRNSFAGNLPRALEADKLSALKELIVERLGVVPEIYRAGRYGIGPNSFGTLRELGFKVDSSVVPFTSFAAQGGPDFRRHSHEPFIRDGILEIPLTGGFVGIARRLGPSQFDTAQRVRSPVPLPGVLAKLRVLERCRLSPEQERLEGLIRLTRVLLREGTRVFCLSLHSSSLVAGGTPYVPRGTDVATLLDRIEAYCRFFVDEIGGAGTTSDELSELLAGQGARRVA